ncbi:3-deoxy-D-manno-octulosonic-acid transferase [Shimia gijangensis]|uniref:3-deoxy-D-manno-octulosonic acid transferase n=1 Tax=Shimia gijangensis TaxID=1470563 RepID=A0A1M6NPW5_9RHOB|nr:glycosyltransferase N-terminal domain-containing protein [Shimia gijangensis]SHJ97710.1 3-deoxy-D-manno-octulosonic-acid transferase [Shimia gijangensis]
MARSLGLSAYLAFARREAPSLDRITDQRPDGQLLWLHSSDPVRVDCLARLALRLKAQRGNLNLMVTTSPGQPLPRNAPKGVSVQICASENPQDVKTFLDHWKPDACMWLGPWLRPGLISAAYRQSIPLFLLDADEPGLENRRWRLMPEPVRATLNQFERIFAHSKEAEYRMRRLTQEPRRVLASGPLLEDSPALPCNETDLEELASAIGGRPVWLASQVQIQELGTILDAHRSISRLSHRTLLVLVPDQASDAAAMTALCRDEGWRVGHWEDGDIPQSNTQILISDDKQALGLWYRVAPVTLMGSSLISGHGGRNPLEPAALGSAILYGPGVRDYLDSYSRLAQAGAARIVKDASSLISALSLVTAPDQAATMAHAGWEVVSEGAEVSDQIIAVVQDALDQREVS